MSLPWVFVCPGSSKDVWIAWLQVSCAILTKKDKMKTQKFLAFMLLWHGGIPFRVGEPASLLVHKNIYTILLSCLQSFKSVPVSISRQRQVTKVRLTFWEGIYQTWQRYLMLCFTRFSCRDQGAKNFSLHCLNVLLWYLLGVQCLANCDLSFELIATLLSSDFVLSCSSLISR